MAFPMELTGELLLGADTKFGEGKSFQGINPATGEELAPAYGGATDQDIDSACALAGSAFDSYRATTMEQRAAFLEKAASNILELGDALIERACAETGLPRAPHRRRARPNRRAAAPVCRSRTGRRLARGAHRARNAPSPAAAQRPICACATSPLGPVAVFGASNFPLAFSVAGGDTASALAAGCPVLVKAHPAHPGTSELVGRAMRAAVAESGLPAGVFSLLFGTGNALGAALVADPRIKAVGFHRLPSGGLALVALRGSSGPSRSLSMPR